MEQQELKESRFVIESNDELKYLMAYHNIPYIKIKDGKHDMGKVTNKMQYEHGAYCYKTAFQYLSFEKACEQLSNDYEQVKVWKETAKKVFATRLLYGKRNEPKKVETSYVWKSDFEKCHILVGNDENGRLMLKGRINDLKNFLRYAKDHMTYCQESYYFEDEELNNAIELFDRYGLKLDDDESYEWWRVGIVD